MDSFEFNKLAGAVLGTGLFVMALSIISEIIYEPAAPAKPGYVVEVKETEAGGGAAASGPVASIAARLQTANVENGATVAKKCLACHTLMKGEPAKVGPNLWGVVAGPSAHMVDFKYSAAMLAKHEQGLTWTYDNLDQFLTAPKTFIPDTAMGFAGLPKPSDRADVIAYLRSLSDSPAPLPPPPAAAPVTAAAAPPATAAPAPAVKAALVGNAEAGADVFKRCAGCHKIGPNATNGFGPVLNGVVGRPAGSYPGYDYSAANKGSGVVWTEKALTDYLPSPQMYIPGTKMPVGLADPQDVADVIAYLKGFDAQGNKVAATP